MHDPKAVQRSEIAYTYKLARRDKLGIDRLGISYHLRRLGPCSVVVVGHEERLKQFVFASSWPS